MKRSVCILLCLTLAVSAFVFGANAEENPRISPALRDCLDQISDGDFVEVWVFLDHILNHLEMEERVYEECGLKGTDIASMDDANLYTQTWRRLVSELNTGINKAFQEKHGITEDEIIYSSRGVTAMILRITKTKVYELAEDEEVEEMGLFGDGALSIPEDPTVAERKLTEAVREYYHSDAIKASQVIEIYSEDIDESRSVKKILVTNAAVPSVIVQKKFGRYTMSTSRPVPLYYDGVRLYEIDSAYKRGMITSEEIDALLDVKWLGLKKSDVKKGDTDCDGTVTVIDATLIQKRLAAIVGQNAVDSENADFDCDGSVTVIDATGVQKYLAKAE